METKQWSAEFVRIEQSEYGPRVLFKKKDGSGTYSMTPNQGLDVSTMQPGQRYQIKVGQTQSGYYSLLLSFKAAQSGGGYRGGGGGGGYEYDPLQFVSNVVGHAIEAGLIKEPTELGPWATAAWEMSDKPKPPQPSQPAQAEGGAGSPPPEYEGYS